MRRVMRVIGLSAKDFNVSFVAGWVRVIHLERKGKSKEMKEKELHRLQGASLYTFF